MLSRGNTGGATPSALTASNVLLPKISWAVMKTVNPFTHRGPKTRKCFIAIFWQFRSCFDRVEKMPQIHGHEFQKYFDASRFLPCSVAQPHFVCRRRIQTRPGLFAAGRRAARRGDQNAAVDQQRRLSRYAPRLVALRAETIRCRQTGLRDGL